MKKAFSLAFILILFLIGFGNIASAQTVLKGKISGTLYNQPIPFPHLISQPSGIHYLGDKEGAFEIREKDSIASLTIKAPLHRTMIYQVFNDSIDDLNIRMIQNSIIPPGSKTEAGFQELLEAIFRNTLKLNPLKSIPYSQKTYSKFHLGVQNLQQTKYLVNRIGRIGGFRLPDFGKDHHLFLAESFSRKDLLGRNHQQEEILAAAVTGIGDPSLFTLNSLADPSGMFENYYRILSKHYPNPIAGNPFKRYFFYPSDTIYLGEDTLNIVVFHPKAGKRVGKLKGYLVVNISGKRVERIVAGPALESKLRLVHAEEYVFQKGALFPLEQKTDFFITRIGMISGVKGSLRSYFQQPLEPISSSRSFYDEVVLEYPDSITKDQEAWQDLRMEKFTEKDEATLEFYDSLGRIESLENLATFGERIYYGKVPFKWVDLDMNRIINFNLYEDIRLGFGLHTNHRFSRYIKLGGFGGYGFGDEQAKYGGDFSFFPGGTPLWEIKILAERDLREAGSTSYERDKRMFNTERLRAYQLSIFDMVDRFNIGTGGRISKYLSGWISYQRSVEDPQYRYSFRDQNIDQYEYSELGIQFRLGYGEQYIQSVWDRISIKKPYPIFWAKLTFGNDWFGGEYSFFKWESKLEYVERFLGYGKSHFRLVFNYTPDVLPYGKLFNGHGGFREFSIVIHNAFETMRYNEFLSDQMFAIFYSHNFGPISIKFLNHFPTLEMSHNIGFGNLRNKEVHDGIDFETMEKGYFESGLFINDLIIFRNLGLKTGIGAGFFYRYGPYGFSDPLDNLVFKLALNFGV